MNPEMLLSFLRDNGIIDEVQLSDLRDEQTRTGKSIEEVVANGGVIRLTELYAMIAQSLGTDVVEVSTMNLAEPS